MTTVLALLLVIVAGLGLPLDSAVAQGGESSSFLDPFPENDRYRVQVWGDDMAEGLLDGLSEQLAEEPRLQLDKKQRWLNGLLKVDIDQEGRAIEQALAEGTPHIVILLLGSQDRLSLRRSNGRRIPVGSDEWKGEYARRLDIVMRALRKRSVGVFWIGLPVMRRQDVSEDAEMINELVRNRALANGVRFIDIFKSFADGDGGYSSHGPDLAGKTRLLRDQDGIHFTGAGYRKLAYFVERELKRAATQAWEERAIPLAGSEAEQARVRPAPSVKLGPLVASGAKPTPKSAIGGGTNAAATTGAGGGLKAESSRVTLRTLGDQGREQSVTIEILRPAIPASVVSLLTRRESRDKPSHVGDAVMTEILGGVTVVSSVTPIGEAGSRRRGAGDQTTPLYRVLQRGESLPPKPGRADEMPWPRPEPALDPRLSRPLEPEPASAPIDTGSVPQAAKAMPSDGPPLPRRPSPSFGLRAQ
ncbi:MAG: GDSL-type esterase/lipase family protein [Hyphomicrobiaceae bacterium]